MESLIIFQSHFLTLPFFSERTRFHEHGLKSETSIWCASCGDFRLCHSIIQQQNRPVCCFSFFLRSAGIKMKRKTAIREEKHTRRNVTDCNDHHVVLVRQNTPSSSVRGSPVQCRCKHFSSAPAAGQLYFSP